MKMQQSVMLLTVTASLVKSEISICHISFAFSNLLTITYISNAAENLLIHCYL